MTRMVERSGLALVRPPILGGWSGLHEWGYAQDLLILRAATRRERRFAMLPAWLRGLMRQLGVA
jgi:hypothetical protein